MGKQVQTSALYRAFIHSESRTYQKQGDLLNLGESFKLENRTQAQPNESEKLD